MKKLTFPIIIFVLLFGAVALAQDAELPDLGILPDSPFYFLEIISEEIGNFFTFGDIKKAERYAALSAERMAEAENLVEKGKPEFIEKTLQRYENQLNKSLARAKRAQARGNSVKNIMEVVAEGTGKHLTVIEGILEKVSEKARTALTRAKETSMAGQKNSLRTLAKEDPEKAAEITLKAAEYSLNKAKVKSEEDKIDEVKEAVKEFEGYHELGGEISQIAKELGKDITSAEQLVEKATSIHLEILADIYEKVPETTKSIIEEAIKISVKGHEQALESLKTKGVLEGPAQEIIIPEKIPAKIQEKTKEEVREEIQKEKLEESLEEVGEEPAQSVGATSCSRPFSPQFRAEPYYTGPLFDAHFHMPSSKGLAEMMSQMHGGESTSDPVLGKDVTLKEILCFFDEEKVRGAIGFYTVSVASLGDTLEVARTIKEESLDSIALFLMPVVLDAERLDSLHKSNTGLFKGYGELAFYDVGLKPLTPGDQKLLSIYDVAEKHGLTVMMHPDMGQKSDIERALQNNPRVNFLLHGFEIENDITDLMDRYPNVYFSIDSAVLYPMMGLFISGPKEQFISKFRQEFDAILNSKINKWKGAIESHPSRFMWGTDRGVKWHYDEEISVLFEEFARAFIARLDPEVQENYAYQNTEKLLGR